MPRFIKHHAPVQPPHPLELSPARRHAVEAIDDLLSRLRMEHVFVGGVAHAVWLGEMFESGSVDVLALMAPQSVQQIPMMASNRGFIVDRDEVEAAAELDLVPLAVPFEGEVIRCHVLIASNALYASMMKRAVETSLGDRALRVIDAEDLALMLLLANEEKGNDAARRVIAAAGPSFDLERWRQRLASIGISKTVLM